MTGSPIRLVERFIDRHKDTRPQTILTFLRRDCRLADFDEFSMSVFPIRPSRSATLPAS
jgi:hypothetical protein